MVATAIISADAHAAPLALLASISATITTPALNPLPAAVANELSRSAPFPSAQVVGSRYRSSVSCKVDAAELVQAISASGPVALRVTGRAANGARCQAYAFVDVRVTAEALVATRPIREGASLEGSVRLVRRDISRGESPITELPDGVVATRSLSAGQLIDAQLFHLAALMPGSAVRVQLRAGALLVEETGHVVPCGGSNGANPATHACATVLSGKRVEGKFAEGAIQVESP